MISTLGKGLQRGYKQEPLEDPQDSARFSQSINLFLVCNNKYKNEGWKWNKNNALKEMLQYSLTKYAGNSRNLQTNYLRDDDNDRPEGRSVVVDDDEQRVRRNPTSITASHFGQSRKINFVALSREHNTNCIFSITLENILLDGEQRLPTTLI